jgi:hypothetical protein
MTKRWDDSLPEYCSAPGVFDLAKWREHMLKVAREAHLNYPPYVMKALDPDPKDAA